ncbi:MAG: muramoyltetrapeptide carboxypeptidase [Janthinobacterium lividum]
MTASYSHKPRHIRLVAPSGYPENPADVTRAVERLHAEGHHVDNLAAARRRFERFAGTDDERAADIDALADTTVPLPDIVLAVRGGYGAMRLLHGLDYDGIARRCADKPPIIVGHSDFTALQMALLTHARVITFGGPMLARNFGQENLNRFTMAHFWAILQSSEYTVHGTVRDQPDLDVSGVLWGGNLAMLAALAGTPFMPSIDGGILFVEDVNEQPFRTERMLYQLYLAGILQRQQALVMGTFSGGAAADYNNGFSLDSVAEQIGRVAGIPVVRGLQFGHVDEMLTLPVGAQGRLRAGATGFSLTMSGYPTLA